MGRFLYVVCKDFGQVSGKTDLKFGAPENFGEGAVRGFIYVKSFYFGAPSAGMPIRACPADGVFIVGF